MPNIAKVHGIERLQRRLRRKAKTYGKATVRGLLKAGLHLQRVSQQLVPVDTGALKNSAFTRQEGDDVTVGYTQAYALPVHERTYVNHPIGQAKFLEQPLRTEEAEMKRIIKQEAKK